MVQWMFLAQDSSPLPAGRSLRITTLPEPLWQNGDLKEMLDQGLEPAIVEMTAYSSGVPPGIARRRFPLRTFQSWELTDSRSL
jgi:hypothetical protein